MKTLEFLNIIEICPWQIFSIRIVYPHILSRYAHIFHSHVDESSVFWGENKGLSDGKRGADTLLI